jgi:hypothetical protein
MTVSGLTITKADRQPLHIRESQAQRSRSAALRRTLWERVERCKDQELMPEGKDLCLERGPSSKALPN